MSVMSASSLLPPQLQWQILIVHLQGIILKFKQFNDISFSDFSNITFQKFFHIFRVHNTLENKWKIFTRMIIKNVIKIGFKLFASFYWVACKHI